MGGFAMAAGVLAACLCAQAPKASMLGASKPWWEALKPGDVVPLRPPAGAAVPMASMFDFGAGWTRSHADRFAGATAGRRWRELHEMADRDELELRFGGSWVRIGSIWSDPVLHLEVAEVIAYPTEAAARRGDPPGDFIGEPEGPFAVPVPYLGGPGRRRHPALGALPVLVRRSRDLAAVKCAAAGCKRLEAIAWSDAERADADRRRRQDEMRRRGAAEAARRARRHAAAAAE